MKIRKEMFPEELTCSALISRDDAANLIRRRDTGSTEGRSWFREILQFRFPDFHCGTLILSFVFQYQKYCAYAAKSGFANASLGMRYQFIEID
jgi:hypothetical protein